MNTRSGRRAPLVCALLVPVLGVLLSSCASAPDELSSQRSVAQESTQSDAVEALLSLDVSAVSTIMFQNTTDLGERSSAVIVGTVHRWLAGDTVTTTTGAYVGAALLAEIEVTDVASKSESAAVRPGDVIYVPVTSPSMDPQEVADALPRELDVVAYLDDALTGEQLKVSQGYEVKAGDAEAAGKPRWPLLSPQGFIVTNPSDPSEQIWPFLGSRAEGELIDVLPGGPLDGLTGEQRKLIV